ncbi:hypothetical protein BD414DRAFT_488966 [Trametes punicea]|nr:hypothetical protein BD414DRAFT_488966 [Trametes punicea]
MNCLALLTVRPLLDLTATQPIAELRPHPSFYPLGRLLHGRDLGSSAMCRIAYLCLYTQIFLTVRAASLRDVGIGVSSPS